MINSVEQIAIIIPSFRVTGQILDVINKIGPEVWRIYVVDDNCPDNSGNYVKTYCNDSRVVVIRHQINQGVGGAVITGYLAAISDGAKILIKIDGDGQMDPHLIRYFTEPIITGEADYTKGNRFYDLEKIRAMPGLRLFGNAILSFMTKLS